MNVILKDLLKNFNDKKLLEDYALKNPENIYSLETNNKKAGNEVKKVIENSKNLDYVIEYINTKGDLMLIYKGGVFVPLKERIINENGRNYFGTLISDLWIDDIFQSNSTEGSVNLPGGKKPEKLIKRILDLATDENDIVLDFFMGTGTTCAVAHKMKRQYIGIEQLDYGKNSAYQRLKNVIKGDKTGISKEVNWQGGGDFIYMELMKLNEIFVEKIQNIKSKEDLLKIYNDIKQHSFLNYKVEISAFSEHIEEFIKLDLEKQKKVILELLDYNNLYVNFTEIEDETYNICNNDKLLNYDFYKSYEK